MEKVKEEQIFEAINTAHRILIALPQNSNGDAVGSGLALHQFLKKLDKEPEVATAVEDLSVFDFLPGVSQIKNALETSSSFVISVKTENATLDELSYETKNDRIDIFLKPKTGEFSEEDITFAKGKFPYDLVITLDTPSLEHLGSVYEKNTDLFFETTIINIDHHPNNENYGEINHVDLTATSTAEILSELIEAYEDKLMDQDIATNLLTGIIVETNSFQHVKTTPRAFLKASNLISQGAKQQDIIKQLYKTKNIGLLKLWGRALARIREQTEIGLIYSLISHADIQKAGAAPEDVTGVMKELVYNLSGHRIIMLLAEMQPSYVVGYFHLHPAIPAHVISSVLGGQMLNGSYGSFEIKGKTILEVEKEVLDKLNRIKEQVSV